MHLLYPEARRFMNKEIVPRGEGCPSESIVFKAPYKLQMHHALFMSVRRSIHIDPKHMPLLYNLARPVTVTISPSLFFLSFLIYSAN